MTHDRLVQYLRLVLGKKPPKVIAASFFSLSSFIVLFGYVRGYRATDMFLAVLASLTISLAALGIRWLEKRCPAPPGPQPRHTILRHDDHRP